MKARDDNISVELIRSILDYDPSTGRLIWRFRNDVPKEWNTKHFGKDAGSLDPHGYIRVKIFDQKVMAHRLAWMHHYGERPAEGIDHVNLNRSDNRICNLRAATRSENHRNRRVYSHSKLGVKGVKLLKGKYYVVRIGVGSGQMKHIGCFSTIEEAKLAYLEAQKIYHGEFARTE
jgi:hypothetical protein